MDIMYYLTLISAATACQSHWLQADRDKENTFAGVPHIYEENPFIIIGSNKVVDTLITP